MVNDLHDLLSHAGLQPMVNTGYAVQGDHAEAIDGRADHTVDIAVQRREGNAQAQGRHAHGPAHNMRDRIHNFLSHRIVGQHPVCQLCPLECHNTHILSGSAGAFPFFFLFSQYSSFCVFLVPTAVDSTLYTAERPGFSPQ